MSFGDILSILLDVCNSLDVLNGFGGERITSFGEPILILCEYSIVFVKKSRTSVSLVNS